MARQKTWAQGLLQTNLGKGVSSMSLERASRRPWVGLGGLEDRIVPFISEFGDSDGEDDCGM